MDRFERFSFAISEISKYWHKITTEEMEKYHLKGAHSVYLLTIYRFPEGITTSKLCEICGKDKSDASRMISIMEKRGLIMKESVHQNSYGSMIKLTDEGRRAAEHVRKRADFAVELAGKELTDEKRMIFYEALDIITSNLKRLSQEGIPQQ